MDWKEVPAPRRKADYAGKRLRLPETPPKQRHKYDPSPELPIRPGDVAQIWMRRSFRDAECGDVDISSWPEGRILELRWECPFCAALHPVLIPESWIEVGKAVFVEPAEGEEA
ncbi:MAG: hypothetical protein K2J64_05915 [Desulfovibrio sp.]|nr:hypothetical protein [Desulfovibrio sp.]